MFDVVAPADYEVPRFSCLKEGFPYSYGAKEWTALKLRVALVFFGEPDSLGELKYAVDALRFYAAAKRTAIDRVAHAIGAQVKALNRGNSDGVGATVCILTLWVMFVLGPQVSIRFWSICDAHLV